MTGRRAHWDAVVVGAGPAGSAAALNLARRGRSVVVLDRAVFPRDKSCGDGLTPRAVELLDGMDLLGRFDAFAPVTGLHAVMRGRGARDFPFAAARRRPYGLVVPRMKLDETLVLAAREAGATVLQGMRVRRLLFDGGRVAGVVAEDRAGAVEEFRATVTLAADGAKSVVRRLATLEGEEDAPLGFAIRGYFEGLAELPSRLEIVLPLTDPTDRHVLPSYGWIFPTGPTTANVGVGLFSTVAHDDVRRLYERFVAGLQASDPRFIKAKPTGRPLGAPLRFDFAPERCAAPGLLLAGDAAGLVSPFSGEGITYALESGSLAAETIDRCLRLSPGRPPFEDDYRTLMEHRFAGHFELGRRAARRYQLLWRVLESTFASERPIFRAVRRLVLFADDTGGSLAAEFLDDLTPLVPRAGLRLRERTLRVGLRLASVVRGEWPFLAASSLTGRSAGALVLRPSLLFLTCAQLGSADEEELVAIATALDLAWLATLALSGVEDEPAEPDSPTNWGNKFAVLLSDYLLAKAFEEGDPGRVGLSRWIMDAIERACAAEIEYSRGRGSFTVEEHLTASAERTALLFSLPCALAALVCNQPNLEGPLRDYGEAVGVTYAITEESRAAREGRREESSGFAAALVAEETANGVAHDAGTRGDELAQSLASAQATKARAAVLRLPPGPAATLLLRLSQYVLTRSIRGEQQLDEDQWRRSE